MDREQFKQKIIDMAHVATLDEVKAYWDKKVENEAKKWGANDFWTKQQIGKREQAIKDFKEGKPVEFYEDSGMFYHHDSGCCGYGGNILLRGIMRLSLFRRHL